MTLIGPSEWSWNLANVQSTLWQIYEKNSTDLNHLFYCVTNPGKSWLWQVWHLWNKITVIVAMFHLSTGCRNYWHLSKCVYSLWNFLFLSLVLFFSQNYKSIHPSCCLPQTKSPKAGLFFFFKDRNIHQPLCTHTQTRTRILCFKYVGFKYVADLVIWCSQSLHRLKNIWFSHTHTHKLIHTCVLFAAFVAADKCKHSSMATVSSNKQKHRAWSTYTYRHMYLHR